MTPYQIARNLADSLLRGETNRSTKLIQEKVQTALLMLASAEIARDVDEEALIRDLETSYSIWMAQGTIIEDQQDHIDHRIE